MSSESDNDEINNSSEYDDVSDYSEDYEIPIINNTFPNPEPSNKLDDNFTKKYSGQGSRMGSKRLMDELKIFTPEHSAKFGYSIETVDDNLYNWQIKLFNFPTDSKLYKDLAVYNKKNKIDYIMLDVTFPEQFPYQPPFIRVLYPRFQFMTGHITIGGSICMEVLTSSGWSPGYSIENLIMQIKSEIVDPHGEARIDLSRNDHYNIHEAKESFDRLCAKYGWK